MLVANYCNDILIRNNNISINSKIIINILKLLKEESYCLAINICRIRSKQISAKKGILNGNVTPKPPLTKKDGPSKKEHEIKLLEYQIK